MRVGLLALLVACGGPKTPAPPGDDRRDDGAGDSDDTDDVGDTDDSAAQPPWGLDARPSNTTCLAPARPLLVSAGNIGLEPAFPALTFRRPTSVTLSPDATTWFVTESEGTVLSFSDDPAVTETHAVIDIQDRVTGQIEGGGEMGLLGLAFHPNFAANGQVFLSYTTTQTDGSFQSRISRFHSTDGAVSLDPSSEEVLLTLDQPNENHNGGRIGFAPDGMLWAGFGDGGGATHQADAPDPQFLYGKLLRVDVDGAAPYGIPPDNPWADGVDGRPEVWAVGLRNPWGWTIDPVTSEVWVADVGPASWEEINLVVPGGNYGWPTHIGPDCVVATALCDVPDLVEPVYAYPRDEGLAVIGGVVYRGQDLPGLTEKYLFADYLSGWIRSLTRDPTTGDVTVTPVIEGITERISTFAVDARGEVLVMTFGYSGQLQRLVPAGGADTGTPVVDPFPTQLSETGCVDPADATKPAAGLIPYGVQWPFWADGLEKSTWLALPDGAVPELAEGGDITLPIGTVLLKELRDAERRVETRLFVRHEDGGWAGYAYVWDADGLDATLAAGATRTETTVGVHDVPHRWQCLECHNAEAGGSLGFALNQLGTTVTYPSTERTADQLVTLQHIGVLPETLPDIAPLPDPADAADLSAWARGWLHVNCASCHQPGIPQSGHIDLRAPTPLAETGACDVEPLDGSLGAEDARVIALGAPERSVLWLRAGRTDLNRMPPVGVHQIDAQAITQLEGWLTSLESCDE